MKGDKMKLRALWVALTTALLAGVLILAGQPALVSTQAPQSVAGLTAVKVSLAPAAYRPFNEDNFRFNLIERTGYDPGTRCQAHHTIPKKFEMRAGVAGVNVHDPIYGLWWVSTPRLPRNHPSLSSEYNASWQRFFDTHPSVTEAQILAERDRIVPVYQADYRC